MEGAKIQLSDAEMRLVCDAGLILTKNKIMAKARALFEQLQAKMQAELPQDAPQFATGPKISKGENYEGLPYLVLDYPRLFAPDSIFAIRSFFWWGNFFSSTLQLSGSWQRQFSPALAGAFDILAQQQYYIQIGSDPWAHHFGPDNYQPISAFSTEAFTEMLYNRPQIKIAAKWPLESWHFAANKLWNSQQLLLSLCGV